MMIVLSGKRVPGCSKEVSSRRSSPPVHEDGESDKKFLPARQESFENRMMRVICTDSVQTLYRACKTYNETACLRETSLENPFLFKNSLLHFFLIRLLIKYFLYYDALIRHIYKKRKAFQRFATGGQRSVKCEHSQWKISENLRKTKIERLKLTGGH